jgi:hypothetical protein
MKKKDVAGSGIFPNASVSVAYILCVSRSGAYFMRQSQWRIFYAPVAVTHYHS